MNRSEMLALVAGHIAQRVSDSPLRVAVDGVDAAGKTTLADELADLLHRRGAFVIRASVDGFHNRDEIRSRQGALSPHGYYEDSYNYMALTTLLLDPLSPGGSRRYATAVFDFRHDHSVNTEFQTAPSNAVLIFDGIFLQRPELANYWDLKIFVDIPFELVLERAASRDLALFGTQAAIRERYLRRYIPGQQLYIEQCAPGDRADIVIDNRNPTQPEILIRSLTLPIKGK